MIDLSGLGLDFFSLAFYFVNFGVVFWAIYYFFGKTITKVLVTRRNLIEGNIKQAEKMKLEIEKLKNDFEKERIESKDFLNKKIKDAEIKIQQSIKESDLKIKKQKNELLKKTNNEILEMKKQAVNDLKDEITIFMKSTILEILKNNANQKVVEESIHSSLSDYLKKYDK